MTKQTQPAVDTEESMDASSADAADRVTDAPHEAARASSPSGSVPTGARFTPGPWSFDYHPEWRDCAIAHVKFALSGGVRGEVATLFGCSVNMVDDPEGERAEIEANARLMAAAPELLDALEKARSVINALYVTMGIGEAGRVANLAFADAAIAKARGQ